MNDIKLPEAYYRLETQYNKIRQLAFEYKNFIQNHDNLYNSGASFDQLSMLEHKMDSRLLEDGFNPSYIHEQVTEEESNNKKIDTKIIESILKVYKKGNKNE
jgi:hypothetical protein